jgi:hypothetical protein
MESQSEGAKTKDSGKSVEIKTTQSSFENNSLSFVASLVFTPL